MVFSAFYIEYISTMVLNYFVNPNLGLQCGYNMCIIDETIPQSTLRGSLLPESLIHISLHACGKFLGELHVKIPQNFGNHIFGVHNYQENNSFNLPFTPTLLLQKQAPVQDLCAKSTLYINTDLTNPYYIIPYGQKFPTQTVGGLFHMEFL
jgi:hypothetical protein